MLHLRKGSPKKRKFVDDEQAAFHTESIRPRVQGDDIDEFPNWKKVKLQAGEAEARSVLDGIDVGGRKKKLAAPVQSALDKLKDALNSSGGEEDDIPSEIGGLAKKLLSAADADSSLTNERQLADEENITSKTFGTFLQRKASDYKVGSGKGKSLSGTKAGVEN